MKKNKNILYLLIFFIFSLMTSLPFFLENSSVRSDFIFHLTRIDALKNNLQDGLLFHPIYYSSLNGFGYANPSFYPDLLLYIPAVFNLMGVSLLASYGLFNLLIMLSTALTAFYVSKVIIKDDLNSFILAIFYTFATDKVVEVIHLGRISYNQIYIFIPILILGIYYCYYTENKNKWYLIALSMFFLLNSHLISTAIIALLLTVFALINHKKTFKKEIFQQLIKSIALFIGLSALFILPMLEMLLSGDYLFSIGNPFNSFLTFADKYLSFDTSDFQVQLLLLNTVIIAILTTLIACLIKLYHQKKLNLNITIGLISLLLYLYSKVVLSDLFPWLILVDTLPCLEVLQYPARLIMFKFIFLAISVSCLSSIVKHKEVIFILVVGYIFYQLSIYTNIRIVDYRQNDYTYKVTHDYEVTGNEIGMGEYLPMNFPINRLPADIEIPFIYDREQFPISEDNGVIITDYTKDKSSIKFSGELVNNEVKVELPLTYYKGYKYYVNGVKYDAQMSDNGLVSIDLKMEDTKTNGVFECEVAYELTIINKLSKLITTSTLLSVTYLYFKNKKGY